MVAKKLRLQKHIIQKLYMYTEHVSAFRMVNVFQFDISLQLVGSNWLRNCSNFNASKF